MDYNYPWTGNPIVTDQYFMELYRGFWTLLGWRWKSKLSHWFCPKMLGTHPESHGSFSILPFWCIPYVWSLDKPLSHHENEISWACSSSLPTLILGIHSGGFETPGRTQSKCYCLKFWYVSMMHLTRIHKQFDWGLETPGMETSWNSWSSRLGLEVLLERGSLVPSCPAPGGVMVMLRLQELDGISDSCHELSLWHFMTPLETVTVWYCMWNLVFGRCAIAEKGMFKSNLEKFANGKRCNASLEVVTVAVRGPSLSMEGPIVSPLSSAWTARAWPSTRCQAEYFEDTPAMPSYVNVFPQFPECSASLMVSTLQSWPFIAKFGMLYWVWIVLSYDLLIFVVVLVVYDYILRIPQHEQHTGRLFGSCDLGRWTPGWTLRVETSPIQYPNLSFVDDMVDDIIIYHPNSSKFIQIHPNSSKFIQIHPNSSNIFPYQDIIWYHATIRFEDRQVLPIGQDWQWNLRNQPRLWTIVETRHHNPAVLGPQPCGACWFWALFHEEQIECGLKQWRSQPLPLVQWWTPFLVLSQSCWLDFHVQLKHGCFAERRAPVETQLKDAEGGCSVFCSRCSRQSSARMSFLSVHQLLWSSCGADVLHCEAKQDGRPQGFARALVCLSIKPSIQQLNQKHPKIVTKSNLGTYHVLS